MGWMWSSSTPDEPPAKGSSQDSGKRDTPTSQPALPAKENPTPPTATKNDANDHPDYELAKFLAQLQAEVGMKPSAPVEPAKPASAAPPEQQQQQQQQQQQKPTTSSSSSSSWWPSWGSWSASSSTTSSSTPSPPTSSSPLSTTNYFSAPQEPSTTDRLDPLSESLLPTTMNCREAFDWAYHCASLGGQWNSVYRHGTVQECSSAWSDFWFCMRTRSYMSGPLKENAIRDYHRQKEIARYRTPGKPASTDVWEARTEMVPRGTAFRMPYREMPDDVSDEEWYAAQIERRRRVQEMLARGEGEGEGEKEGA